MKEQSPFLNGTTLMQRQVPAQADLAAAIDLSREEFRNPGPLLVNPDEDNEQESV